MIIPKNYPYYSEAVRYGYPKRVQEICQEIEQLDPVDNFLFDVIHYIFVTRTLEIELPLDNCNERWDLLLSKHKYFEVDKSSKTIILKKIKHLYKYLMGVVEVTSLNLQQDSLPELLKFVKMFDLAVSITNCMSKNKVSLLRGSYPLREWILENSPEMCSSEAFLKTVSYQNNMLSVSYVSDSKNWVPERVGTHIKLYLNTIVPSLFSKKLLADFGLKGVRGNFAVGKSTFLSKNKGVILNPDTIKFALRKWTNIKNHQIHFEGSSLFKQCFDVIAYDTRQHYSIDNRMKTVDDLKRYLVKPAIQRGCTVSLSDFEVPLLTTFNRLLTRKHDEKDPIPAMSPILLGFSDIRASRKEMLSYIEKQPVIENYNLYYLGEVVARKEFGKICVLDQEGYDECLRVPPNKEIVKIYNRIIDAEYIEEAINRGDLKVEARAVLIGCEGYTIFDALQEHIFKS